MLFLTATCTQRIQDSLKKMIGISITRFYLMLAAQLSSRRVTIDAHYYYTSLLNMFKYIKKTLWNSSHLPKKPIVYSNVHSCSQNIWNYIDADDEINQHEVVLVHEKFSKIEKDRYTQLLLNI